MASFQDILKIILSSQNADSEAKFEASNNLINMKPNQEKESNKQDLLNQKVIICDIEPTQDIAKAWALLKVAMQIQMLCFFIQSTNILSMTANKALLNIVVVCLVGSITAASIDGQQSFYEAVHDPQQKWEFRNQKGFVANFYFRKDGLIQGSNHPNEYRWLWEGGTLVFRSKSNQTTCRFVNTWRDGDLYWRADGLFLGHPINGWRHYLIERD